MAKVTEVRLVDDTDGSVASETLEIGLDGIWYEVDLNDKNAKRARAAILEFASAGRRVGRANATAQRSTSSTSGPRRNLSEAREWLRDNGYPVKDRGRISEEWLADYEAGKPNPPAPAAAPSDADKDGGKDSGGSVVQFKSADAS